MSTLASESATSRACAAGPPSRAARDDAGAPLARRARRSGRRVAGNASASATFAGALAVERLGQEAEHAALRRRDGVRNRAVRGEDDHRQRRMLAWIASNSSMPSIPGIRRSVITTPGRATASARAPPRRCRRCARVARGREPQADELQQVGIVVDQQDVAGRVVIMSSCRASTAASAAAATSTAVIRRRCRRRRCGCDRAAGRAPCCAALQLLDRRIGLLLLVPHRAHPLGHLRPAPPPRAASPQASRDCSCATASSSYTAR